MARSRAAATVSQPADWHTSATPPSHTLTTHPSLVRAGTKKHCPCTTPTCNPSLFDRWGIALLPGEDTPEERKQKRETAQLQFALKRVCACGRGALPVRRGELSRPPTPVRNPCPSHSLMQVFTLLPLPLPLLLLLHRCPPPRPARPLPPVRHPSPPPCPPSSSSCPPPLRRPCWTQAGRTGPGCSCPPHFRPAGQIGRG